MIEYTNIIKLVLAIVVGVMIGLERRKAKKATGSRTLSLVCLGSVFVMILALKYFPLEAGRIVAGILTGLGFLGAGAIIATGKDVSGLTTAATIWAVAIVGIGIGLGEYAISLVLALFIYLLLWSGKFKFY
jgi:putative Mg2+ transporter-C (MgtC) family protein